ERIGDYVSRELFKDILESEEDHIDWLETQLDLIARVGLENYTQSQMGAGYTRTAVALHWLIALLITCGFSLGAYMVDLHISPRKVRFYAYHKWIGITVLALVLIRSVWRLTHKPPPEEPMPRWQLRAAHLTHYLLYALLIATPLCGWLDTSAAGIPVVYLKLWQLPDLVHKNRDLAKVLAEIHGFLAWTLLWV